MKLRHRLLFLSAILLLVGCQHNRRIVDLKQEAAQQAEEAEKQKALMAGACTSPSLYKAFYSSKSLGPQTKVFTPDWLSAPLQTTVMLGVFTLERESESENVRTEKDVLETLSWRACSAPSDGASFWRTMDVALWRDRSQAQDSGSKLGDWFANGKKNRLQLKFSTATQGPRWAAVCTATMSECWFVAAQEQPTLEVYLPESTTGALQVATIEGTANGQMILQPFSQLQFPETAAVEMKRGSP